MKKPLWGCVLCRDCLNRMSPHSVGILTIKDMVILGYSGCTLDSNDRLVIADRKCLDYEVGNERKLE